MRVPLLVILLALSAGCQDLREYAGDWVGPVSADPHLRQGFDPSAVVRTKIALATRERLDATLEVPGTSDPIPFEAIRGAQADALGEMRLDGEPLRSYVGFLRPGGIDPYLAVISLFPEERIVARVIRGPDELYGVFALRRAHEAR